MGRAKLGAEKTFVIIRRVLPLVKRTLMMARTNSEVHQYVFTDGRRQCSNSFKCGIFFNICSNANVFFWAGHKICLENAARLKIILPFVSTSFNRNCQMAIYAANGQLQTW